MKVQQVHPMLSRAKLHNKTKSNYKEATYICSVSFYLRQLGINISTVQQQ